MSRRHQSSRRRSYGRRQHEVNERAHHRAQAVEIHGDWPDRSDAPFGAPVRGMDPRRPRLLTQAIG
jgi:hypothetical protein